MVASHMDHYYIILPTMIIDSHKAGPNEVRATLRVYTQIYIAGYSKTVNLWREQTIPVSDKLVCVHIPVVMTINAELTT